MLTLKASGAIGLLIFATASGALAQDVSVTPDVREAGKLTIASSLAYAPFEFTDEKGAPAGLNIELAHEVAKALGVELDIVPIPFAATIPAIAAKRVKVGWATFSVLPERIAQVDFVAFMQTGVVVSTLPENKEKFAKKTDLCGKTIAVGNGSSSDFSADKLSQECTDAGLPALNKMIFPEQKDAIQAVITGRAEARLDDDTAAGYYEVTTNGRLVVAGDSFYPAPLAIAVPKGDAATAEMIASAFSKIMADGSYQAILHKYGMDNAKLPEPVIYTDASQIPQ